VLDRALREDISVDLTAEPGLWLVEVDPSQLEVAVLNIGLNARDAMPNGGAIKIDLRNDPSALSGAPAVRLSIADAGAGMAPDVVSRIFEPFFTTKGVGRGTGLGLSQVYGFARASGGEVAATSRAGEGTIITLLLPRVERPLDVSEAPVEIVVRAEDRQRRILMVEDDDRVAEWVGEMLHELGYAHERVATADSALERLRRQPDFDIVFSDMVMPGERSGLDLAREIKAAYAGLPVLLTTGYSESASAARAEGLRLILKPYRIETLAGELATALGT